MARVSKSIRISKKDRIKLETMLEHADKTHDQMYSILSGM